MVTLNSFALVTISRSSTNSDWFKYLFLSYKWNSEFFTHLSRFNWTRVFCDHSATLPAISCAPLISLYGTASDVVVSSTYFQTQASLSTSWSLWRSNDDMTYKQRLWRILGTFVISGQCSNLVSTASLFSLVTWLRWNFLKFNRKS